MKFEGKTLFLIKRTILQKNLPAQRTYSNIYIMGYLKSNNARVCLSKKQTVAKATILIHHLRADLNELAAIQITSDLVDDLQNQLDAIILGGTDNLQKSKIAALVEAKNQSKQKLVESMEAIRFVLSLKSGSGSNLLQHDFLSVSKLSDERTIPTVQNLLTDIENNVEALTQAGLSAELRNKLINAFYSFKDSYAKLNEARVLRNVATIDRNSDYFEFLSQLVRFTRAARLWFKLHGDSRARYYVIFKNRKSKTSDKGDVEQGPAPIVDSGQQAA